MTSKIHNTGVETVPKTRNYHDYLIKSLKQPEEAAAYIQAILEEKSPEPEMQPFQSFQPSS